MRYGSVCSGIEAASAAWHSLGWTPAWFAEIEAFPSAVLAHHYPEVPNLGDMTRIHEKEEFKTRAIDLLVGGTPCQSFSVAGLRKGLADPRGNLTLVYLAIAQRARPRWLVWENVPGVLSDDEGRTFGTFLGGLAELGYGFAYRVLDAQYVRVESHARAVPQRRRRVFVVGHLGDWRRAGAVLFERESLQGHSPPRREAGQSPAGTLAARTRGGGGLGTDFKCSGGLIAKTLTTREGRRHDPTLETMVAHTLTGEGFDASFDGTGRGTPLVPIPFDTTQITSPQNRSRPKLGDPSPSLARGSHPPAVAFHNRQDPDPSGAVTHPIGAKDNGLGVLAIDTYNASIDGDVAHTLRVGNDGGAQSTPHVIGGGPFVRRLTPRECERLQGFPDDFTLIPVRGKLVADGPRYKAIGNSMAVNVMAWIGQRIADVDRMGA